MTRPADRELEAAVLGRCLLFPDGAESTVEHLTEDDFTTPAHQHVYRAIARLVEQGGKWDLVEVLQHLDAQESRNLVGGLEGLAGLETQGFVAHSPRHVHRLRKIGEARRVWEAMCVAAESSAEIVRDPEGWLSRSDADITAALDRVEHGGLAQVDLDGAAHEVKRRRRGGGVRGIPTGFATLDRVTGGMHAGDVIVIGARVRVGKSALAMTVADHVSSIERIPTAVFSLEMSSMQQHMRLLAARSGVDLAKLNTGTIDDDNEAELDRVAKHERAPLYIDDTPALNVHRIAARFRAWRRRLNADRCLLVVDYMQLVKGVRAKGDNREREVAMISTALKELARREKVPVVQLAQLSRGADKDDRPRLAHLRESGSIEADADVVWLIHRPECEAKPEDKPKLRGLAELIVAKQRQGPEFTVRMTFDGPRARFAEARSPKEAES